jgi:hypothetical protein
MSIPLLDLQRIATNFAPHSILLVTPPDHPLAASLADRPEVLRVDATNLLEGKTDMPPRRRLALVADTLEHLSASRGETLIALLRDRLAETLYCLADPEQWPAPRMLALGLQPFDVYPRDGGAALYHFDLYDYKRTPDWLNPCNWANPEQWNKHRW